METVKIVFDVDSKDIKSTTDELKALNKVTNDEVAAMEKLSASATDAGDGFVSLRTRVKEAKEEAVKAAEKYGEFSKEANAARQRAGELADQMGDLNRQVNLLNPEAKAKAFSNLAQGVVGAFSVATGALQAFGVKNKEVEALAMKLQGALNITQGIASIGQLKESFADLKIVLGFSTEAQKAMTAASKANVIVTEAETIATTEAAVAQKGFTAALLTNPIFLATAAIASLVGIMIAMSNETEIAKTKVDLLTDSEKELRSATNDATTSLEKKLVAQKKLSAAQAEINKTYRDNKTDVEDLNEKLKENNGNISDNNKIIEKYQYNLKKYAEVSKITSERVAAGTMTEEDANKMRLSYLNENTRAGLIALESNKKLAKSNEDITKAIKEKNEATKNTIDVIKLEDQATKTSKQITDKLKLLEIDKQIALSSTNIEENKYNIEKEFAGKKYKLELEQINLNKGTNEEKEIAYKEYTKNLIDIETNRSNQILSLWEEENKNIAEAIGKQNKIILQNEADLLKETNRNRILIAQNTTEAFKGNRDAELKIQMDILDEQYITDLENAKRTGKDISVINQKYANDQIELSKQITANAITEGEKQKKIAEDLAMKKYLKAKEAMDRTLQATNEVMNAMAEIQAARYNQENIDLEKQKEKGLISEEEYQKKLKEIKHKQDVADKNAAIFKATLDFASAMINALKAPPLAVPAQLAFTAAIAGLNLAKIIATPLPKYQKGTLSVPGVDMGKDSVHALLQPGEAVIPTATNKAYHPTIRAIYEKKISPSEINNFVMSRTKAGSISTNMTASVDTYALGRVLSKNKGVQIENANLVGKAIARELGNRFNARQSL